MDDSPEEWRAIPGLEGAYEVSSLGRVRSLDRTIRIAASKNMREYTQCFKGRLREPKAVGKEGYLMIGLPSPYGSTRVHQLVAAAFLGPKPPDSRIRHINHNLIDNRPENLVYADPHHRFWEKVEKTESCWNWTGSVLKDGYAMFNLKQKNILAHRHSYRIHVGEIPAGLEVDHTCHNRRCVNPEHLRLVTAKQNNENRHADRDGSSGVRGVCWKESRKRWYAGVTHFGKFHYVGEFLDLDVAAEAVRLKRIELYTHNDLDREAS